ncbi:MAG: MBL fold metallo-hydrolase [Ruminococcaceae bacterium]|nr:MBL fold metallo-hydrolase [Oscillospiraceae bacterium]
MEVIIHRGTHQIGGCATEYRTKNTRIFIDFGAELDSENAKPFDIEGVTKGKTNCDAVFFTHYHGDHMGLLDTINKDIPLYMGVASKGIAKILNDRLSKAPDIKSYDVDRIESIKTFEVAKMVVIGDIKITPYMVDHSAYDAYMFKIEADGKSVLHTGDFRTHGFRGKGVKATLEKYVKKVDVLVCEGTTLNRTEAKCETENDLKNRIKAVIEQNKYVFVVCSSTNIDRLAGICSVIPRGKYCICDKYQLSVIEYIREYAGDKSSLYKFDKALYYSENLDEKMNDKGFCMFVRCGNPEHKRIMERYKDKNPVVIYSMWKGYLEQENIKEFLDGYKKFDMHTSGHADSNAIKMVIDTVKPEVVIPMHTEVPEAFLELVGDDKVLLPTDNEVVEVKYE